MSNIRRNWWVLTLTGGLLMGCAQGSVTGGVGGEDGAGGSNTTSTSTGMNTSSSSASGMGGASSSSSGTGMGGDPSTSSSSSTGTGTMCPPMQHFCGGICAGNTPQTGCYGSTTCAACDAAAVPMGGILTCNAQGACDFDCSTGYMKSGNQCVCQTQCCSDADCASGQVCTNGTCQGTTTTGGGTCDGATCTSGCLLMCFPDFGLGVCLGGACQCTCVTP